MNESIRDARSLGNLIRNHRLARSWTQVELSQRAGLRQSSISHLEQGKTNAKLDTLFRVLAVLELKISLQNFEQQAKTISIADL